MFFKVKQSINIHDVTAIKNVVPQYLRFLEKQQPVALHPLLSTFARNTGLAPYLPTGKSKKCGPNRYKIHPPLKY